MLSSTTRYATIVAGGLAAGTLDILYAIGYWAVKANVHPTRILQSVAAGLLGKDSFTGGWNTALLGLLLHFFIAISMAFAYWVFSRYWPPLWQRPVLWGSVYGAGLYAVMNYVVVPLSAAGPGSKDTTWIALSVLVHMFLIGVPIAVFIRKAHFTR